MRLFISANIPDNIKDNVESAQNELRKTGGDVKWVEKDTFHITLRFIGEVSKDKVEVIHAVMAESVRGRSSFEVGLKGLRVLPRPEKPRVICVSGEKGGEELKEIFTKIEEELLMLDFPGEDREFVSHLTIGRVRSKENIELLLGRITENQEKEFGSFKLGNIDLMQSILLPDGPQYKCLRSVSI
jgi:RNA 2',3'-cyclic 3'-phosphodiesterase